MNIGMGGALFVWTGLILVGMWPFLLVSIFMLAKRKSLTKKWIFFFLGVGICYATQIIVGMLSYKFVASATPASPEVMMIRLMVFWGIQVLIATIALVLVSKKFQSSGSVQAAS